jgi:hypothetical protein
MHIMANVAIHLMFARRFFLGTYIATEHDANVS